MNEQIFGAYITAIDQFSSELTEKGVQEFELQNLKYVLTRHGKLLFVASAPTKIKAKKILKWKAKTSFDELVGMMVDHDMELARQEKVLADNPND